MISYLFLAITSEFPFFLSGFHEVSVVSLIFNGLSSLIQLSLPSRLGGWAGSTSSGQP
jgi:hypothetical protein